MSSHNVCLIRQQQLHPAQRFVYVFYVMLVAYVDLKKTLYSVYPEALWELMHLLGILASIVQLLTCLYSRTE